MSAANRLVIGLDLDDVVAKLIDAWLLEYNRRSGDRLTAEDLTSWEISDHVKPEWKERLFELLTGPMYDTVEAYPGTQQAVRAIRRAGHKVWFITSAWSEELFNAKVIWLNRNGFEFDRAIGVGKWSEFKTKQEIPGVDWLVDDHIGNLTGFKGHAVLQTRPHNRLLEWTGKRIKHLDDIVPALVYWNPTEVKRWDSDTNRQLLVPAGRIDTRPLDIMGNGNEDPKAADKLFGLPVITNPNAEKNFIKIVNVPESTFRPGQKSGNPKDAIGSTKVPLHFVSGIVKAYASIAHYLGNVKYGAWNYREGGARASVYVSALGRHIDRWFEGQRLDPVDGTPHLANALACINILIEAEANGNLVDDRPPSQIAALEKAYAEVESLMPKIQERYKDKDPRHFTVADTRKSA